MLFLNLDGAKGDETMEGLFVGLPELPFEVFMPCLKRAMQPSLSHVGRGGVFGLTFGRKGIHRFSNQNFSGFFTKQLGCSKVGRLDLPTLEVNLEEGISRGLEEGAVVFFTLAHFRLLIFDALDLKPWQTQSWMTSKDPEFWAKAGDVCGLYLDPPVNAVVWSVDEKTGIQAKSRINPTKPAVPGASRRQEFEYKRHGTAVLFAGLNVHEGTVAGWVTNSSRSVNFVEFLADLVDQTTTGLELHCIVDNLSAHGTPGVEAFLDEHPHVFLHNTPTHASWLNQVELFFSIMQRRLIRYGEFDSVDNLADRIIEFINNYNKAARPFRWTYDGRPLRVA